MKLEKKHWAMLIAGAVVLFLVYWFFFRKKKTESGYVPGLPMIGENGYSANDINGGTLESGFRSGGVSCKCDEWTGGANNTVYCSHYTPHDCVPGTATARAFTRKNLVKKVPVSTEESNWIIATGDHCPCTPRQGSDGKWRCGCRGTAADGSGLSN